MRMFNGLRAFGIVANVILSTVSRIAKCNANVFTVAPSRISGAGDVWQTFLVIRGKFHWQKLKTSRSHIIVGSACLIASLIGFAT